MGHWNKHLIQNLWEAPKSSTRWNFHHRNIIRQIWSSQLREDCNEQTCLSKLKRKQLIVLLLEFSDVFQARLENWKGPLINITLKKDTTPQYSRSYVTLQAHLAPLKKEVNRLVSLGVLSLVPYSEWASPTFAMPKKDQTIRVVHDFRKVNTQILRKVFPFHESKTRYTKLDVSNMPQTST